MIKRVVSPGTGGIGRPLIRGMSAAPIRARKALRNVDAVGDRGKILVGGQVDPCGRPRFLLVGGQQKSQRVDV
jgi:hypothetical protein